MPRTVVRRIGPMNRVLADERDGSLYHRRNVLYVLVGDAVTNDALRKALTDARMSADDLAATIGVDPKTVARWLADEGRTPHPRHRWQTADALGVEEGVLWPDVVRAALKTGHDREIVAVYPYRSNVPRTLWRDLISRAEQRLDFAGFTNYFLWLEHPGLRATLRRKADAGAAVRWLVGDPDSQVTAERVGAADRLHPYQG